MMLIMPYVEQSYKITNQCVPFVFLFTVVLGHIRFVETSFGFGSFLCIQFVNLKAGDSFTNE